ncbi:hypothetical protein IAU60_000883 [Kwoniella sp. DSM 27419]
MSTGSSTAPTTTAMHSTGVDPRHVSVGEKVKEAAGAASTHIRGLGEPLSLETRFHPGVEGQGATSARRLLREESEMSEEERKTRDQAAQTIQRYYRGHRDRNRVRTVHMQRDARWDDLVKQTGEQTYAKQQLDNKNDVMSRWRRAVHAAARLQEGEGVYDPPKSLTQEVAYEDLPEKVRKARKATFLGSLSMGVGKEAPNGQDEQAVLPFQSKALEQQHWLEMIDSKHRYGSNMKYYFRKWKEADTRDNFFRWLDIGGGKDLDLEELPRERLEKEVITYLSAEQRLNYLIKVDRDGRLRWARNDELVDTAAGKWKDGGQGTGIYPFDSATDDGHGDEPGEERDRHDGSAYTGTSKTPRSTRSSPSRSREEESDGASSSSVSYSASSDLDDNEDTHYAGLDQPDDRGWSARKKERLTPGGIRKELLRKTVRRNTWIYVSDMKLNLFVGIKTSGTFQHSSFLAGGRVTSAGIIVVKQGVIKSLNPLSGHYRSSIEHFRAFITQLETRGVDLSHVKMAKSVLSLWGLSKYAQVTKKEHDVMTHIRRALHISHELTEKEKSAELQENAEREEREHQERMRAVDDAEKQRGGEGRGSGQGEEDRDEEEKAEVTRLRKEVIVGHEGDGGWKKSV